MARRRGSVWVAAVRTPVGACSAVLLAVVVVLAVLAPLLWGDAAAAIDTDAIGQGPSGAHPFGTDSLGRDLFFRTLVATRLSIGLAVLATAIGVGAGVVLGTLPSVLPRWAGRLLTSGDQHRGGVPRPAAGAVPRGHLRRRARRARCWRSRSRWRRRSPGWCRRCPRR